MGLVSKQSTLEAAVTTGMQVSLSLESFLFSKFDGIFWEAVSTLKCPRGSLTPNLPPHLGNLAGIFL